MPKESGKNYAWRARRRVGRVIKKEGFMRKKAMSISLNSLEMEMARLLAGRSGHSVSSFIALILENMVHTWRCPLCTKKFDPPDQPTEIQKAVFNRRDYLDKKAHAQARLEALLAIEQDYHQGKTPPSFKPFQKDPDAAQPIKVADVDDGPSIETLI